MAVIEAIIDFLLGQFSYLVVLQVTQMLRNKFPVNRPRGVGGVGFQINLLMTHDGRRTTDID